MDEKKYILDVYNNLVLMASWKFDLQHSVYSFYKICSNYNLKINKDETKIMTFMEITLHLQHFMELKYIFWKKKSSTYIGFAFSCFEETDLISLTKF